MKEHKKTKEFTSEYQSLFLTPEQANYLTHNTVKNFLQKFPHTGITKARLNHIKAYIKNRHRTIMNGPKVKEDQKIMQRWKKQLNRQTMRNRGKKYVGQWYPFHEFPKKEPMTNTTSTPQE